METKQYKEIQTCVMEMCLALNTIAARITVLQTIIDEEFKK